MHVIIDTTASIPTKFCHEILVIDGPNMHITNPRWRTAAILKKKSKKSQYLSNVLTDQHEILHNGTE